MNHSKKNPVRVFWIGILYALCAIGLSAQEENAPTPETNNPEPIVVPAEPTPSKPVTTDTTPSSGKRSKKYNLKSKGTKIVEIDDEGTGDRINTGKRYALVIGINKYQNEVDFAVLNKAVNDAKAMGKILKEKGEFDNVLVMTDDAGLESPLYPRKSNILNQLDEALKDAKPEDLFLFYFSGHGVTADENADGNDPKDNGYLVSYDTYRSKIRDTGIKIDSIVSTIKAKKLEKTLLVLDACRNKITNEKSGTVKGLQSKDFEKAKIAATFYSTENEKVSYEDPESDFGVFTRFLLWGIEGNADGNDDNVVTLNELKDYVETGVREWSEEKISEKKLEIIQNPAMRIYGDFKGNLAISLGKKADKSKYVETIVPRNLSPVWRSTLLPGWGQHYNGSDFKGNMLFASLFVSAGFLASSYNSYKEAERNFQDTSNSVLFYPANPSLSVLGYLNSRSLYSEYQARANTFSIASGVLLFIYAFNLADSFWWSNRTPFISTQKATPAESAPSQSSGFNINIFMQPTVQYNAYTPEKVAVINYTWRF